MNNHRWHQLNFRIPAAIVKELDLHVKSGAARNRAQLITDILRFWIEYQNSTISFTPAQLALLRPYMPKKSSTDIV